jgi:multicomponent Na+:H+ antiporter subunit E
MSRLVFNLLLALAWTAITGQFTPGNFAAGLVVGYLALLLAGDRSRTRTYAIKVPRALGLLLFFLRELIAANIRVAIEVITPWHSMRPAVVAVPLDLRNDAGLLLLTSMITLTPDSLSLMVSDDRRILYIHCMYVPDAVEYRRRIKEDYERRILELMQ